MKTIIFTVSIMALLVMVGSVSASLMPCPFSGKIEVAPGVDLEGRTIGLFYNGVLIATGITASDGSYSIDIGGYKECDVGEIITVKVLDCEGNYACEGSIDQDGSNAYGMNFNLVGVELPATTATTTTTTTTVPEVYDTDSVLGMFITAVIGCGGGAAVVYVKKGRVKFEKAGLENIVKNMPKGCGVRLTKAYNGAGSVKHWHPGRASYHSLSDKHKGKYDHNGEEKLFPEYLYEDK